MRIFSNNKKLLYQPHFGRLSIPSAYILHREVINICGYIKHQRILRDCLLFNVNQHILGIFMTRT